MFAEIKSVAFRSVRHKNVAQFASAGVFVAKSHGIFHMANESKYELVSSLDTNSATITQRTDLQTELPDLLRQLIAVQNKQNELLQEVVNQLTAAQRQRNIELAQWKRANPTLANSCKIAADCLGKLQTEFLTSLAYDVDDNFEDLQGNEYLLNEFFEKYGPRIIHLNTILQTLSVLGNAPDLSNTISNN